MSVQSSSSRVLHVAEAEKAKILNDVQQNEKGFENWTFTKYSKKDLTVQQLRSRTIVQRFQQGIMEGCGIATNKKPMMATRGSCPTTNAYNIHRQVPYIQYVFIQTTAIIVLYFTTLNFKFSYIQYILFTMFTI